MSDDQRKRTLGVYSAQAREAIEEAVWGRSVGLMHEARALQDGGGLTAERAHGILISMIEMNRMISRLDGQVKDGTRAAERIEKAAVDASNEMEAATKMRENGLNRFTRSRAS